MDDSNTTTTHLMCYKAGLSSIYGPTLLVDFAENKGMDPYTIHHMRKAVMDELDTGVIEPAEKWTSEFLPWLIENKNTARKINSNKGYELIQGSGTVKGHLIGGCLEVFDEHRGTDLFPTLEDFDGAVLFFETSEDKPPAWYVEVALRTYGMMGILDRVVGMIWGKPMDEANYDEYNETSKKVLAEFNRQDMPVVANVNFGHTEPKICLPYGGIMEIDCDGPVLRGLF